MANPWFRFKQFTVYHDKCAMKVTTDACLFGAWVAAQMTNHAAIKNVLDIGTGTGLLSLMLAQKLSQTEIDAVELDANAAGQAQANAGQSPFSKRVHVIQHDILQFQSPHQYNLIISNPPFHERQLASPDTEKNKAHHDATLTLSQLATTCQRMLHAEGTIAILLPYYRKEEAITLFQEQGFYPKAICDARQSASHSFFRTMILFGAQTQQPVSEEIIVIKNADQHYSPEFVTLLKDFYLIF